jgi:hypothetical protein
MKLSTLLLGALSCVPAHAAPAKDGNFSVTCTLTEKRQVTGGMLVGTKMAPQRVKVHHLDGGFTFKYQGVMYSSSPARRRGCGQHARGSAIHLFET